MTAPAEFDINRSRHLTLLCARFWPELHGGVETHVWHFSQTLAKRGWHVEVITANRTGAPDDEWLGANLRVRRLPALQPGRLWRWLAWLHVWWWYRALRAVRPQGVVWATDPTMGAAAVIGGYRRRLVYNPAACAPGMNSIGRAYPHVDTMQLKKPWEWADRLAYRGAATVALTSHNVRRQFARFFGGRSSVHVVSYGVAIPQPMPSRDDARRQRGIGANEFVVGFVGRLDPCKDLGFLFDAVAADPGVCDRILIVGGGSDRSRLEAHARDVGVADRIMWVGASATPFDWYPIMDVLVLPSIYEAYGQVLLEAMGSGVPVIGRAADDRSILNAMDEIIEDGGTGFITDAHDPRALASRLRRLRDHPDTARTMGEKGRQRALSQSWDWNADRSEDVIAGLRAAKQTATGETMDHDERVETV
jgi:glycosyltransferase involved in cell wall biosynthesis